MSDIESGMRQPMSEEKKKGILGCCGLVGLLTFIFFVVCMANYAHLGPDDQVLIKSASGKTVVNGPTSLQLHPFKDKEWRKATLLDPLRYARVQNQLTAVVRHEEGPQLLFLGPEDELISTSNKLVLEKDDYVRLVDRATGIERVERGPKNLMPTPGEEQRGGVQKAIYLDTDSAVIVQNKDTGIQRLVTDHGVFAPAAQEEIVVVRDVIHVLPHEAVLVRDAQGTMTVYSGAESNGAGTAFFLPPHSRLVRMFWSYFGDPSSASPNVGPPTTTTTAGTTTTMAVHRRRRTQNSATTTRGPSASGTGSVELEEDEGEVPMGKTVVTKIDLRWRQAFFDYEVRTNDNVKLGLEGSIFWQISDVRKMINATSDPEGDLWQRVRSKMIQAVSNVTLGGFMTNVTDIVGRAFANRDQDNFWVMRGISLRSVELTKYTCLDANTAATLRNIIRTTTERINQLQQQQSNNEVAAERLAADIQLEGHRTELITTQALNARLVAETAGATEGGKIAMSAAAFIQDLNRTMGNVSSVVDLYSMQKRYEHSNIDMRQLSSGNSTLMVTQKDMDLKLVMPSHPSEL